MPSSTSRSTRLLRLANATLLAALLGACASPSPPTEEPKKIVSVAWTTSDFVTPISEAVVCEAVGILVTTRGYRQGDAIVVTIDEIEDVDFERVLHGVVDADGKARLRWSDDTCDLSDSSGPN